MNNQIFSTTRFSNYLRKYLFENRGRMLVNAATVVLLPVIFCVLIPFITGCYNNSPTIFTSRFDVMWEREINFFIFAAIAIGAAFCSEFYLVLKKKTSRISVLTLPVSSLEKFCTYFLLYVIVYSALVLGSFFLADAIRVWIYSSRATEGLMIDYLTPRMLFTIGSSLHNTMDGHAMSPDAAVIGAFALSSIMLGQSFYAMGSSVWPKNSFLKSTCFLFIFNVVSSTLMFWGFNIFYAHRISSPRPIFDQSPYAIAGWIIVAAAVLSIFMWCISYFRFKEWEVTDRW